jgi:hypothetical protein
MALTAVDPNTGSVVFPFDNGCTKAECRDVNCGASVVAVREAKFEDVTMRRSHWRHQVKTKRCNTTRTSSASKETIWHWNWKMRCSDAERIEYQHAIRRGPDRVSIRRADVWTKFGWALEFQHSAITQLDVRRRENHYQGRVVWVVDCASSGHVNGAFDLDGPYVRWHAAPEWLKHTRSLVAVDDGQQIHLLPPNFSSQLTTNGERVFRDSVVTYEHSAWVDIWMNGQAHPLGEDFASNWTLERRNRAKDRELNRRMDLMIEQSYRRAQYGSDVCSFRGDRRKLVFIQDRLFEVLICRIETCNSAASFDGTCYAHSVNSEDRP